MKSKKLQSKGILISIILLIIFSLTCCDSNNGKGGKMIEAARSGKIERVKRLIEEGANVNAKDEDGSTALIEAAGNGNIEIVKVLIEKGAKINAKNNGGLTALMYSNGDSPTTLEILLSNKKRYIILVG